MNLTIDFIKFCCQRLNGIVHVEFWLVVAMSFQFILFKLDSSLAGNHSVLVSLELLLQLCDVLPAVYGELGEALGGIGRMLLDKLCEIVAKFLVGVGSAIDLLLSGSHLRAQCASLGEQVGNLSRRKVLNFFERWHKANNRVE